MANISGKSYGLTAITRMHPLKTFGLRAVFAGIALSLMPPAKRAAIAIGVTGPVVVGVVDAFIRLLVAVHVASSPWTPAWDIGVALGMHGWYATLVGIVTIAVVSAVLGGSIGSVYQPKWTILGRISQIQVNLTNLSFIHFARWVIIKRDEFPHFGGAQPRETFNYDYLLFESNFNGDWEKYIDAFSDVVPGGMDNIWRWSVRYPFSRPISPFLDYIRNCQYDTDHYYSAYPGASTNDVLGALNLDKAMTEFVAKTATMSADQFAAEYAHFTVKVQNFIQTTGAPPFPLLGERPVTAPAVNVGEATMKSIRAAFLPTA